ncbi:MAG: hypothetical protein LBT82_03530 [Oscillospiraceae bacterium]|jgi:hypothetical protein|nr:hypothetical protein [Oscillospiraceae bacterium]
MIVDLIVAIFAGTVVLFPVLKFTFAKKSKTDKIDCKSCGGKCQFCYSKNKKNKT